MKTTWFLVVLGLDLTIGALPGRAQLAVCGQTIYTLAGEPLREGVVLVRGDKIETVGPADQVRIPDGWRTLRTKVVTPGLIDAHAVVGLSGLLNQPQDQEQLDRSAPLQPLGLRTMASKKQKLALIILLVLQVDMGTLDLQ